MGIEYDALYSDETRMFCSPMDPDPGDLVKIRMRTAQFGADRVVLRHEEEWIDMRLEFVQDGFDYYSAQIRVGAVPYPYWFELFKSGEHVIFTKTGVRAEADEWAQFRILPGFHTPEWAWGAVMYQIFPDRFCSGDDSNDVLEHEYQYLGSHVKKAKSWDELPDPRLDVGCFHGGDLQGVLDKLD